MANPKLVAAIETARKTGKLDLYNCRIGNAEFIEFIQPLLDDEVITTIKYLSYPLSNETVHLLTRALMTNKTLKELDLSYSITSLEGIQALAELLKVNKTLMKLSLVNCFINKESIKALTEALKLNNTLTKLYFSHNQSIAGGFNVRGPEGIECMTMLAGAIQENKSLTTFVINSFRIPEEAVIIVKNALEVNTTLIDFGLGSDTSETEQFVGIPKLLTRNRTLLAQKKNQRLATVETLLTTRDKQGKLIPNRTLIDDPKLLHAIFAFTDFESEKTQQQRFQQEQEIKYKEENSVPPAKRMKNLIAELKEKLNTMPNPHSLSNAQKENIKTKIITLRKNILKNSEFSEHALNKLDNETIKSEIQELKQYFKTDKANPNTSSILDIADNLLNEWEWIMDEYNQNSVQKMLAFIERLKSRKSYEFQGPAQEAKVKTEINHRMEHILADNKLKQYCFKEEDVKSINKEIIAFENTFKNLEGIDAIVQNLQENVEKIFLSSPKILSMPEEVKVHLEPQVPDLNPNLNLEKEHLPEEVPPKPVVLSTGEDKEVMDIRNRGELFRILENNRFDNLTHFQKLLSTIDTNVPVNGATLLQTACKNKNTPLKFIEALLKQAADPNVATVNPKTHKSITSLEYAIMHDRQDIVKCLIRNKKTIISPSLWQQMLKTYGTGNKKAQTPMIALIHEGLQNSQPSVSTPKSK